MSNFLLQKALIFFIYKILSFYKVIEISLGDHFFMSHHVDQQCTMTPTLKTLCAMYQVVYMQLYRPYSTNHCSISN